MKMYKILDQIIKFITEAMKNWKVEVAAGGKTLGEVKMQRGIFQGDAVSPLLFAIAMVPFTHILRKCTDLQIHKDEFISYVRGRHQAACKKNKK